MQTATLAGGCFWCTEAIFKRLKGVSSVRPGYAGGHVDNPTYEQVCSGNTGHAEAIQIEFDPEQISFSTLLDVFFHLHDPTTKNQQGADYGTQYRSAIFYHDEEQKKIADEVIDHVEKEKVYKNPIVTEVVPFTKFYEAEDYHKDYFANNQSAPYCQVVIDPKIRKLLDTYKPLLK
ncbi:peptide-methionine (S)-S-oxide reductase MsrA [Candidatus Microgenomates bacterium]|nr:peptide-methionine (S)-S-oxide reductase MsrA [Candidatus Microgenomates bacterium]